MSTGKRQVNERRRRSSHARLVDSRKTRGGNSCEQQEEKKRCRTRFWNKMKAVGGFFTTSTGGVCVYKRTRRLSHVFVEIRPGTGNRSSRTVRSIQRSGILGFEHDDQTFEMEIQRPIPVDFGSAYSVHRMTKQYGTLVYELQLGYISVVLSKNEKSSHLSFFIVRPEP